MLDVTKGQLLAELQGRIGRAKGIHVRDLVRQVTGAVDNFDVLERKVRDLVQLLRMEGHPICAHPADGYYWADPNTAELDDACAFLLSRAKASVDQVAAMRGVPPINLYALLSLPQPSQPTTGA